MLPTAAGLGAPDTLYRSPGEVGQERRGQNAVRIVRALYPLGCSYIIPNSYFLEHVIGKEEPE